MACFWNLQPSPCIRFNKEGILLAVSTNDNGIKILANADGVRLLRTVENRTFDASRVATASVIMVGCSDVDYFFQTSNLGYIC